MSIITVTVFPCVYSLAMNNVSSSDVIFTHPSQTQPGLLATAVPHSIPRKVCTLSPSLMTVNVCAYFICTFVITSHVISHQLTVQCRQKKKRAPCLMHRGSAATDGRFVYITPDGFYSLYRYEFSTDEWMELPSCPYSNSGLAIIDSELTTVGGWEYGAGHATNKLFTLLRQGEWVEMYPPMKTAHSSPAVVSTSDGDYLIVIGGHVSGKWWSATVELLHVQKKKWYKLTDLPQPLPLPSATICGDQLHVIGDDDNGYSCSLQSLPSNDKPIISPLTLSWKPLPPLPVTGSTAATLCGQLVLIGGWQRGSPVNSIHQLVEGQNEIGSMTMRSGRWRCLAVSPSPDRILIEGSSWLNQCLFRAVLVLYHCVSVPFLFIF